MDKESGRSSFVILQDAAYHAANRAWSGLYSFLTAQSVLVLAWAAILQVTSVTDRAWVMLTVSMVGVLTSLMWSMIGTRMWDYHLGYASKLHVLADRSDGLPAWSEAHGVVRKEWDYRCAKENEPWYSVAARRVAVLSASHWLMFLAPMLFSLMHMVMLLTVLCYPIDASCGLSCWILVNFPDYARWSFYGSVCLVYVAGVVLVCIKCKRSLLGDGLFGVR